MIYYFSATGNSFHVAKRLGDAYISKDLRFALDNDTAHLSEITCRGLYIVFLRLYNKVKNT